MKQLVVLVVCCVILLELIGCQSPAGNQSGVEVIIEGGGEFPEFLAGRWRGNRGAWEFVFEPDGSISSAVIGPGEVRIVPGRSKTVAMKMGGKGIYEPGLWTVQYSPSGRELTVEVVMDHVHLEMGPDLLEGKRTDVFAGEVSEDGRIWRAEWFSFPDYIAYTPEPKRLAYEPEESFVGTIIFEKLVREEE